MTKQRFILSLLLLVFFAMGQNFAQSVEQEQKRIADSLGLYYFNQAIASFGVNNDSTHRCLEKALVQYQKAKNWDGIVHCQAAFSSLSGYRGHYLAYDSLTDLAFELAQTHLKEDSEVYWSVLNNHAYKLREKGDLEKGIPYFHQIINHDKEQGNLLDMASSMGNLADCYFIKGDFDQALKYRQQARQYRLDTLGVSWRTAASSIAIGDCFRQKNKNEDALQWYEKAVSVLTKERKEKGEGEIILRLTANALFNMSEIMLDQKNWNQAKAHIAQANNLSQRVYVMNQGRGEELLGDLYTEQGDFEKALKCYQRSKKLVIKEFEVFEKHPLIAAKDLKIAELYQSYGQWSLAIPFYQKALAQLTYDFNGEDFFQNPKSENIYGQLNALKILQGKAECFHELFKKDQKERYLQLAYETFQLALDLIGSLRQDYLAEESKQLLSSRVLPLFEGTIDVAIEWHRYTGNKKYLEEAFTYAESNKAILLLESINESAAKKFAGIPSHLLEEEKSLSLEIAHIEKLINEEKQQGTTAQLDKVRLLEREWFEWTTNYQKLIHTFEQDYPLYYQLKYNIQRADITEVQQKMLDPNKALIEFFVGDRSIYVFTVLKNDVKVNIVEKDAAFVQSVHYLRDLISQAPLQENLRQGFQQYVHEASVLYEQLIAPSELTDIDQLIIVPDDILTYLPFEVLLTERPAPSATHYSLDQLAYFFEDYSIHYSYSSALLLNDRVREQRQALTEFVGFAPSFKNTEVANSSRNCNAEELYSLQCSQQEVEQIYDLLGGEIWLGEKARKASFKAVAPISKILHLATHACVDEQNPQFNKIYFADDYLSNNDLYNLLFQAELAVLSACNTGSGQLVRGEGVMSLSRGFIHAGCPSVVMSLWAVDDCATSNIMVDFYRGLKTGIDKPAALRQAKINFLNQAKKDRQHPYYWAAFVQFGKADKLDFNHSYFGFSYWWVLGLAFGLLFLGFQSKSVIGKWRTGTRPYLTR